MLRTSIITFDEDALQRMLRRHEQAAHDHTKLRNVTFRSWHGLSWPSSKASQVEMRPRWI